MLNSLRYLIVAVVQLLSCVQCFVTPWTVAHQASLSFTIFQSLLKLISFELVKLSNHFFLGDIWFSLINSNLLMFQLPSLFWNHSYISWLHPCLFGAVPRSYLRCYVLVLSQLLSVTLNYVANLTFIGLVVFICKVILVYGHIRDLNIKGL